MSPTALQICRDITIVDRTDEIRTPFDRDGVFIVVGCLIVCIAIAVYRWKYP